ncbi:MAG: glycosyltransferase family 39 protein [Anaerolineae bacterium]|nr:glycosyltransferase family 39 protein [Anaerolineae bacterium]
MFNSKVQGWKAGGYGLGLLILALGLALFSNSGVSISGWPSYSLMLLVAFGLMYWGWRSIRADSPPSWLHTALIIAFTLRLVAGVFWTLALPAWGYDTPVQNAGYIMADAYDRDHAAWELAQSDLPLTSAFQNFSASDQYGGLLYLSALIYRFIGGGSHQPLLMVILTASISSLAVLFAWAFSRRIWGDTAARMAAWMLVIYPEAVLLGSSQMREAFMVTLAAGAFYALLRLRDGLSWKGGIWLAVPILLSLPLSFPFFVLLMGGLIFTAFVMDDWRVLRAKWFWGAAAIGIILLIAASAAGWVDFARLWPFQAVRWQAFYSQSASGWIQRTFERLPEGMEWVQIPFLVLYGVFRPLLPASFFDGIPLLRAVAIWRALGWTALLALLFYATFMAVRSLRKEGVTFTILLLIWALILAASLRGGGDQWDNPRYRSAFAALQVGAAAWALFQRRETNDPWFRRAVVGTIVMVVWFVPWYLRRYSDFTWPLVALHQTIGMGLLSTFLFVLWDWIRELNGKQEMSRNGVGE